MIQLKLGHHFICEATDCNVELLNNESFLIETLTEACKLGGAGVVSVQSKKFDPQGVTVLVLLSESHCSIHSWPELSYAALDVFTCGSTVQGNVILKYITEKLEGNYYIQEFSRGIPKTIKGE